MLSTLRRRRVEIGGLAVLAGTMAFLVIEASAEASYPGFDRVHDPLSRLGELAAPSRGLWELGLVVLAVTWLVGAVIAIAWDRSATWLAIDLLPVVGVGVAALVPLDQNLAVHEAGAFAAFLGGSLAVLANAHNLRSPWRELSVGLGLVALAGMSPASGILIQYLGWGALERIVVFPLILAIGLFGLAVAAGARRGDSPVGAWGRGTAAIVLVGLVLGLAGIGNGLTAGGYERIVAWLGTVLAGAG